MDPGKGMSEKSGRIKITQPQGVGNMNMESFLDQLETAEFERPIILELQVQEALDSLGLIRSIRPNLSIS